MNGQLNSSLVLLVLRAALITNQQQIWKEKKQIVVVELRRKAEEEEEEKAGERKQRGKEKCQTLDKEKNTYYLMLQCYVDASIVGYLKCPTLRHLGHK